MYVHCCEIQAGLPPYHLPVDAVGAVELAVEVVAGVAGALLPVGRLTVSEAEVAEVASAAWPLYSHR